MRKIVLLLLLTILAVGCSTKKESINVESVSLNTASLEMTVGETVKLIAKVIPSNADDANVTWGTSNQNIATVSDGRVSAIAEGTCTITASAGGKSATCQVKVQKATIDVASITLSKTEIELTEGESLTITATIKPYDATDKTVVWTTSDATIATVSNGKIEAVKEGSCIIKASAGGKSAECKVTVNRIVIPVSAISLNKSNLTLAKGQFETLIATVEPDNTTDKTVNWSSSNKAIANVDSNGTVTAVAAGTATITAKAGDKVASCSVIVTVPVESVSLNYYNIALYEGESVALTATVTPNDATNKTVIWTSSDEHVATVDQNGLVRAIKEGKTIIYAKADNKVAACNLDVWKKYVYTHVSLDKDNLTVLVGDTATLEATVTSTEPDKTVTWSSSNSSVATVENGVVKGIGVGRATITATACGESASCSVLVVEDSKDGVYARYDGGSIVTINGKIQSGSKLSYRVYNYSSEDIRILSVQLIDGQTGNEGNVLSIGSNIVSGTSSAWTITIGASGIYEPRARFAFTFKGKTYYCEAQYTNL